MQADGWMRFFVLLAGIGVGAAAMGVALALRAPAVPVATAAPAPTPRATPAPTPAPTKVPVPTPPARPTPPPPTPTPSPTRAPLDLRSVRDAIAAGRTVEARAQIDQLLLQEPGSATLRVLAALSWIREGKLQEAGPLLKEAAGLDPTCPDLPVVQGHERMLSGDHDGARLRYDEALQRRPGDPEALEGRAAARYHLRELAGAIEDATDALRGNPSRALALFTRARALEKLDRPRDAVRDYDAFLELRPEDAEAWRNRGNLRVRLGDRGLAVRDFRRAMELRPDWVAELKVLVADLEK